MKQFLLTSLLCVFSSLLSLSLSDLPSSCLSDLIGPTAGRCCTPHTFILVEFTLGFGCDVPESLDGGVRFEVERARQQWEPIRFYSPTLTEAEPSLVHFDEAGTVHAQAFNENSTFNFHFVNASEGPVRIREYLCGEEYANETVRFRWMQRYEPPSIENVSTWWLDDIRISRWDGAMLSTIMENNFTQDLTSDNSFNIRAGMVEIPSCSPSDDPVLYFRNTSTQAIPRRSLVITHFSLNCSPSEGNCPPPVPRLMQDSDCSVTSCGAQSVKCSVGSFLECSTCPDGFSVQKETPTNSNSSSSFNPVACLDEDECALMTHNCSGVAACMNTFGSFYCSCPPGYTISPEGNTCLDIDECSSDSNCSQICTNTIGSFNCSCLPGYILDDGGTLCTVPRVAFDSSDYTVAEGGSITLVVQLLDDIIQPLTFTVRTEDMSAVSGSDYRPLNSSLTFHPGGESSLTVMMEALTDDEAEVVESFRVVLSQSSLGIEESATVYIIDSNDVLVEFDDTNYTAIEGEDVIFRVVKRTDSNREVTVVFNTRSNTRPGSASAGSDYEPKVSLRLMFPPGEMELTVNVSTLDDSVLERDEEFVGILELLPEGGVILGHFKATATILDDDEVTIGFRSPAYEVAEGEGVEVTVEMRGETNIDVVVNVATQDSTAGGTEDYTSINKTLTFSNTVTIHNISIGTTDDNLFEGNKLFQLFLSQPRPPSDGVMLTETIVTNVTILDDDALTVTLGFEQSAYNVSEDDRPFSVCVRVTKGQLEDQITITIDNNNMEAIAGEDYRWPSISPQLTLVPGQTMACLGNVTLIDDSESEGEDPEQFQLILQAPATTMRGQEVIINPETALVTIYDDDELLSALEGLESLSSSDPDGASNRLSRLVDRILESGRLLPPRISMEILEASQELLQNIGMGGRRSSNSSVGNRILSILDRFALGAYDEKTQPELKVKGLRLRVQEFAAAPSSPTVLGINQSDTMIELPMEAFTRAGQTVRVASFIFSNLSNALTNRTDDPEAENVRIGSPVISTALGCGRRSRNKCPANATSGFTMPVTIVLPIMRQGNESVSCSFLNLTDNLWSKEGCTTVNITDTSVVCECYHLTHFAILLSPNLNITGPHAVALQVIGYVGVSISLVCMVLTIVALLALKTLWGMRNYIHVNLCVCLIIAQLIFVIGVDKTQNQSACSAIAVLLHYWFLAAFMWMLMEGVVLYVALVRVFVKKQRFYIAGFTIVSYGLPLLYMVITVPLGLVMKDEKGNNYYGSEEACWLRYDTHFVWAFIVPVILIILTNIGFFIMAVYIMYKHQRRSVHKAAVKKVKHWLKTSIALLFIMGITWIIGVLVFHEALLFVAYIFTIFVAFQGAVIFIMFILLSKQVRENYKKWWRGKVAESDILSKYFSSSESSSGGKKGLGRFSSLRTSTFRLSRNRSTFRSSNIDSEMKLPDEQPEPHQDTLSPEMRMNEYLKKQRYALGESVTETSDHFTDEPGTSLKKAKYNDSIVETTEHFPSVNGQANGVAIIVTKAEEAAESNQGHFDENHHDPMPTSQDAESSSSSNKPDQTLVSEDDPPHCQGGGDSLDSSSLDNPQLASQLVQDRQNTEQNTSL